MTQALFTSMTGLNAGTHQLTVVSDNVANMNTTAYKTSRVDFQDIWYQTKSGGTNSTYRMGGTNPYQVGVGVNCSAITKNMDSSSVTTTGRSEDMAIQGDGWFTVINSDGQALYTRDGSFSLDEEGYLVTAIGCKLVGMDEVESVTCSTEPIKIPYAIRVIEKETPTDVLKQLTVKELNNCQIASGTVAFKVGGSDDILYLDLSGLNSTTYVDSGTDSLVSLINTSRVLKEDGTVNSAANGYFQASVTVDGRLTFTAGAQSIEFVSGGTSNFNSQLNLITPGPVAAGATLNSKEMNLSASIYEATDVTADDTHIRKSWGIGTDGLLTVTYSDGSTLSVKAGADDKTYFSYVDPNGIVIDSAISTTPSEKSLYVSPSLLLKANMQVQIAKFVNNNGLVAVGNNCYENGVNTGMVIYTTANKNGVGQLATGALECSNVDLAQQFSNMILAQRLVQANSQVFSSANSMLETLVYLGRG